MGGGLTMDRLIRAEIIKLLKARKNKILLLALVLLILMTNIYYRYKQNIYMDELEKETTISYNSAQMRINNVMTELARFDSEEETDKMILIRDYGSIEKAEAKRGLLEIELERNKKESSYVQSLMLLEKQLVTGRGITIEDENDMLRQILNLKIRRTNNIIEADKEGVVPESALKLRKITMDDIRRKNTYYNYLYDNDIMYSINPYTNTGVFSISKLMENSTILFIFLILTFISIDLFLSEVDEGSYKVVYIQPYDRSKIFFSKILAIILFIILILVIILSINFIANTILNGSGDFSEPIAVTRNINKISLNNENIEFKIISIGNNILLSILLFLIVVFFNIVFISTLSIFTDSTIKTVGIELILIILSLLLREFLSPDSIVHSIFPYSYIFVQDVLIQRFKTNYILGILLDIGLSAALMFVGHKKFIKKDFLGSKV